MRSYTDLEQSKRLAEFLPLKSADMSYTWDFDDEQYYINTEKFSNWRVPKYAESAKHKQVIPCWSLVALLDVLPDEVGDNHYLTLDKEGKEYCCCYEDCNGNSFKHCFSDNPIDACVAMIEKLNELNLL